MHTALLIWRALLPFTARRRRRILLAISAASISATSLRQTAPFCAAGRWSPLQLALNTDIASLPHVLDFIIGANGCYVPGVAFRSSKRYIRSDGKGGRRSKLRARNRKATLTCLPINLDAQEAVDSIVNGNISIVLDILENSILETESDREESESGSEGRRRTMKRIMNNIKYAD